MASVTGAPYSFARDDPLDRADPLGLCAKALPGDPPINCSGTPVPMNGTLSPVDTSPAAGTEQLPPDPSESSTITTQGPQQSAQPTAKYPSSSTDLLTSEFAPKILGPVRPACSSVTQAELANAQFDRSYPLGALPGTEPCQIVNLWSVAVPPDQNAGVSPLDLLDCAKEGSHGVATAIEETATDETAFGAVVSCVIAFEGGGFGGPPSGNGAGF